MSTTGLWIRYLDFFMFFILNASQFVLLNITVFKCYFELSDFAAKFPNVNLHCYYGSARATPVTDPMKTFATTVEEDVGLNFTNCLDVYNGGFTTNGIYNITPTNWNGTSFEVFCNMTDGGGWTVFQRRVNGSVEFNRNWASYKEGFGELDHEFWLGNDKLFYLTNQGNVQLRIDLVNMTGDPYYAKYDLFRINDEIDYYRLSVVGNYSGTADKEGSDPDDNALGHQIGYPFTTLDRDHDEYFWNCAKYRGGAWWFKKCSQSSLNGNYYGTRIKLSIYWTDLPGNDYKIKYTEMKIKPV
ncbi:fibrinogen-like protein A isoform X2 [Apostichopus japonicus]|uniref:fibrinogen-like protein A isoform X2 n=1 Tax=Stichopus japonicus TaxID=307972 RepID=UPI003AB1DCEC